MKHDNTTTCQFAGLTLVETLVAVSVMAVIMAVLLPQLRSIQNSWDSQTYASETLQNARILLDHLNRNLSTATQITAVSDPDVTGGYIEFVDNDANTLRYDINSANNYVEFGPLGNLADLAGPVSQLRFTCYDACDLNVSTVDVDAIRSVKVETTLTNSGQGLDKTFTSQAYLRTNAVETAWTLYKVKESEIEFDLQRCLYPALVPIDSTHYLCVYQGDGDDGWAVVFTVDPANWTLAAGIPFEFDTLDGRTPALSQIDGTHYLCAYEGEGSGGWAVVLTVDTGNWTITAETPFEYDTQKGQEPALAKIDDTHYLCAYRGDGDDGWAVVLTVNTGTWTITAETPFEFDIADCATPEISKIDDVYYLCAYTGGGDDGWAVVLAVGAASWDITAETPLEFDTSKGMAPAVVKIGTEHHLCSYRGEGDDGWVTVLGVNPFTKIITQETPFEFDPIKGETPAISTMGDGEHFLCVYSGDGDDGWGIVLNVAELPWSIAGGSSVEFDVSKAQEPAVAVLDDTHYLCVYRGDGDDGFACIIYRGGDILP